MLMKNKAATKKRNRMWNLACVSGSFFYREELKPKHTRLVRQKRSSLGDGRVAVDSLHNNPPPLEEN